MKTIISKKIQWKDMTKLKNNKIIKLINSNKKIINKTLFLFRKTKKQNKIKNFLNIKI